MYNCNTGAIEYSRDYINGTFALNDRVTAIGQTWRIDPPIQYTNPGGSALSITATGLTGCPATTSTTTTLPPLTTSLSITCDNTQPGATYLGKATITISGGTGVYEVAAGFVGSIGAYVSIGTNPFVITSPTAPYTGSIGLRNSTGPSDQFVVQVRDSNGTVVSKSGLVSCTYTTTTTTSTTTTIALPPFSFYTNTGRNSSIGACYATPSIYLWAYSNIWGSGNTYYQGTSGGPDVPLTLYPGANQWFSNSGTAIQIDDYGVSYNDTACTPTTTTTTTTTTTAPPITCNHLLVTVTSIDRAASDDGYVYFEAGDCAGNPIYLQYNTNKTNFDTGYCYSSGYATNVYILVGGVPTAPTGGSTIVMGSPC